MTGQVQLQSQFFATGTQSDLDTLNREQTPAGVTLQAAAHRRPGRAELIASAILTKNGPAELPGRSGRRRGKSVLSGYAAGGFLSTSGNPAARATLAVVIIPGTPPATSDASGASQTLVSVAQQLNLAGNGTVMAGQVSGSGPGSAIDVLRSSGRADHFSSVDDADTAIGQIIVAQALYEQVTSGNSGNYGSLASATAAAPSPAPTPSPSAHRHRDREPVREYEAHASSGPPTRRHRLGGRAVSRGRGCAGTPPGP